jgi:transcriptional regulator with XRE-family HTH domain
VVDPIKTLGPLVRQRRKDLSLSLRQASEVSGVPVATLSRVEKGGMPDFGTFSMIVEWLGENPDQFFTMTKRSENTPDEIAIHLRSDPALKLDAAEKIADIVRDLYQSLASTDRRLAVHLRAAKTFSPPALFLITDILNEIQVSLDNSGSE